ncbi:MAG: hypothetical protein HRU12_14320, partial [Phaeodactylibacter sp.]|nr:hypothetical protein [Phaeodactylibacter sp.]
GMLDVTSDDIKSLSAKDIEDLIGLLCDAELAAHNISNAGVTRGGKIDEADEGIDIKVSVESLPRGDGYIPRCLTAYQVKKPDMPERKIRTEMCPSGRLRPAIKRIAETGGAYIIVSSGRSLSEPLLNKRLVAMREALGNTKCFVDFYGSTRIATWVNNFPGLVYWVKEKLGRPLSGWQGHGNWTSSRSDSANDYVLDKGIVLRRLYGNNEVTFQKENSTLRGEEALAYVRSILKKEKSSIRIVGLSGVGKTRFVQALFEDEIGADALPSHLVLYTDWGNRNPAPDPFDILCQLEYRRDRAILVLDNCSTKSHSEITRQLMNSSSQVSLITIEHDVREDFPVDTNAFALEPSSDDIIEKVLSNRFSKLSFSSIRRLASLSGGNFRIAIALAQYVSKNEDISELTDANLFDRIFWQNNQPNEELLSAAEVLSLVYSFDFSDYSDGSEISQFGVLAELSGRRIHKHVAELERRGLVQARGTWRAVLPHALANRLAKKCLENIPLKEIRLLLEQPKNIRLLKSSSRRMSYLKPYPKALELTAEWLEKDGIIWNRSNYDITQLEILKNLTVLHPSKVLDYFKLTIGEWGRATRSQFGLYDKIRKILTYIAYEPAYFVDSVDLLVHMYLSETTSIDATNFQQSIIAFFQVILSGTNAPVQERIRCMRNIWAIESPEAKKLAIDCLSAALKTQHFNGHPIFHFQYARKDYGFRPKDWNETRSWYHAFL